MTNIFKARDRKAQKLSGSLGAEPEDSTKKGCIDTRVSNKAFVNKEGRQEW